MRAGLPLHFLPLVLSFSPLQYCPWEVLPRPRSPHFVFLLLVMPLWTDPGGIRWSVRVSVCLCMRVSLQLGFLKAHNKLSTNMCHIGTTQQYLKANSLRFLIRALVFSYSLICSPWHLFETSQFTRRPTSSHRVAFQLDSRVYAATGQAAT